VSTSPEFRRVISTRTFVQPGLLLATFAAICSGVLLFLLIFVTGALAWLLIQISSQGVSGMDQGLLPLADVLRQYPAGSFGATLIESRPLLQTSGAAAAVLMLAAVVLLGLQWGFRLLAGILLDRHVAGAIMKLRQHIHRKAIRLEPADLSGDQARSSDRMFQVATRTLESSASRWGHLWLSIVSDVLGAGVAALVTDWRLALQVMIPVILGRMALRMEMERSDSSGRLLVEQVERGLRRMAEGLKKTRIVTSFGMEQVEHQQFENHLGDYRKRCRHLQRQQRIGHAIRNVLLLIVVLVPTGFLVVHILRGDHAAKAVMMGSCLILIYRGVGGIAGMTELAAEGGERAEEISTYLNRIPAVSQAPGASFLQPMSRTLTFNQLSFQTSQLPALLRGLDLRINFGERVALLSLHPVAAYALASMIPRFVDPDLGQVLIDGRDIREATLESLRAEAIYVGGNDPVFNATVLENITCGQPDITRQQAQDAAKLVHADHFIRTLPRSYDTVLGEHGVALDPGQSFRLSLARAIVREPALLVIEEPPLALDTETKTLLDDAYQRIFTNRTVIFLPHRLSTVKKCSRIILIHEGKVAVDGVHEQLVRSSELYRHWEYVRFNPFREETE